MWILIICLFLLPLLYVFFAPIYIEVDSTQNLYRLRFHRFASVRLVVWEDRLMAEVKVVFWVKYIDLLKKNKNRAKENKKTQLEKKSSNAGGRPSIKKMSKKIPRLLKTFKVEKCSLSVDTGDMPLNGKLYPVIYLLSILTQQKMYINFVGENVLVVTIKNSIARMAWAFVRS